MKAEKYVERFNYFADFSILDISIGNIANKVAPLDKDSNIMDAFLKFMKDENLSLIPVISQEKVVGQLQRNRFLEHTVLGRFGYGLHLNSRKCVCEIMEKTTFVVDYSLTLEEASMRLQSRKIESLYDDLIVTKNEKYYGTVPVNILLDALTQKALLLAKESNPLTGLPGNWVIQREIEKRIKNKSSFDVSYIDINNFKPYNDHYGFGKGDRVIMVLGKIISDSIKSYKETFAGHIGGDDFIIISMPEASNTICNAVVSNFELYLPEFHGEDFNKSYYVSKNRKGTKEVFPLLSLSCAIVSTEVHIINSYAQLASIAAEIKAEAKRISRVNKLSAIFKDRRND